MKRFLILLLSVISFTQSIKAQSGVAINTSGASAHSSAMLDISSSNKGILIPRIALLAKSNPSPVTGPVTSLMVYNTANAGIGTDAVYPGYYVWTGTQWNRMTLDNDSWSIWGNTGTSSVNHFIGTTDAQPFRIFTNNGPAMYFHPNNGFVGIGDEAPSDNLTIRLNVRGIFATPSDYSGIQLKPLGYPSAGNNYGLHIGLDRLAYKNARIMNYDPTGDLWFGLQDHDVLHLKNQKMFVGINEDNPQDNLTIRLNPAGVYSGPDNYSGILINPSTKINAGNNNGLHLGLDNSAQSTARLMNNENGDLFLGTNKYGILYLKGSNLFAGINTSNPNHTLTVMAGINGIYSTPYEGLGVITPGNSSGGFATGLVVGSDPVAYANKGMWNYDNGKIAFGTNNLERVTITKDGDVGINTIVPDAKLHVSEGSVVFSAAGSATFASAAPVYGAGRRTMWFVEKAAFRTGYVDGPQWDVMNTGNYSFASGYNNTAVGDYSFVGGGNNTVNAGYGTAFGFNNTLTHFYTAAIGRNNYVDASNSIALGTSNNISSNSDNTMAIGTNINVTGFSGLGFGNNITLGGNNAIAIGNYTQAGGIYSTAIGYSTIASGGFATALGYANNASGISSTAMGENVYAIGNYSTAMGNQNYTYGYYSVAAGQGVWSRADGCSSFGMYNDISDAPIAGSPASTDRIFQLGNGSSSLRSNAVTVLRNGNVGIGLIAPAEKLHVVGNIRSSNLAGTGIRMVTADANGTLGPVTAGSNGQVLTMVAGAPAWASLNPASSWSITGNAGTVAASNFIGTTDAIDLVFRTNNTEKMRITSAGNVGIGATTPAQKLDVQGGNARINNVFIGDVGYGAGWAAISHSGQASTTGYALLNSSDGSFTLINKQNTGAGYIGFRIGNADAAVITNGGYMGIGTINPANRLDVAGIDGWDVANTEGDMRIGNGTYRVKFGVALSGGGAGAASIMQYGAVGGYNALQLGSQGVTSLYVMGSGNIGIGTNSPSKKLEVVGPANGTTPVTMVIGNRGGFGPSALEFVSDYGLGSQWRPGYIKSNDIGSFTGALEFYTNGTGGANVYGNVKGLEVRNGVTYTATGTVSSFSDARLKKDVQPFTDGLEVIKKISPVTFVYNEKAPFQTDKNQVGVIAQDLEKVAPYMVDKNTNKEFKDLLSVNNQAYVFLLINAVKEQQQQIDEQKKQNEEQQKQIDDLSKKIEKLEKLISKTQ